MGRKIYSTPDKSSFIKDRSVCKNHSVSYCTLLIVASLRNNFSFKGFHLKINIVFYKIKLSVIVKIIINI
jgi:hypothetical protein